MSVHKILEYPDPKLREKASPVDSVDKTIQKLAEDMAETMYAAPGIGLAATQIGEPLQVITLDISPGREELIVLVNPEIISSEGECTAEEGCLSLPGFKENIRRKSKVLVRGLNHEGKEVSITAEGLLAAAFQHEIDHLNGVLLLDKVSRLKRMFFKTKLKKKDNP